MAKRSQREDAAPRRLALVCSHGGHLAEILAIREALPGCEAFFFCYDATTTRTLPNAYRVPNKPYSPWRFLANLYLAWRIVSRERPDFLISTGAEIAIPWFLVAKVRGIPSLYIECGAQVTRPSITGRIVVHLADTFLVQWPELLKAYGPRARYEGSLVDEAP